MCGIAGIMSLEGLPIRIEDLVPMCQALVHRGPDDEGFYLGTGVALGMRRLSIIDRKTGGQPVRNEEGTVWAVFNGEIYNFRELRRDLESRGHRFRTAGDSETIVHLYEEFGARCVDRLRGMFAFAVWDERRRQLLVARDRLGIKPLYYGRARDRLVFASELKALLQLPGVDRRIRPSAVDHLFTFLTTPPEESIVEGIVKLPPGHILTASPGRAVKVERYWDVEFHPDEGRDEAFFDGRLRELLDESVRLHMESDVPVGAFLSGGIDSSAVVATMAQVTGRPPVTFSIGFREPGFSELEHARLMARVLGSEHHELVVEPDVLKVLDDLVWYLDEPFGDASAIPTYMVSRLAAEHVTVVLSGDGGDELFGGYEKYLVEGRERRWDALLRPLRPVLAALSRAVPPGVRGHNRLRHFSLAGQSRYLDAGTLLRREDRRRLLLPHVMERIASVKNTATRPDRRSPTDDGWLSELQYLDLKTYLPLDILTKVDRMSMAHSLEARVPLLDHVLVEFAATIPPRLLIRDGVTKYLFKRALRGLVPEALLNRPKQGFAIPLGHWFRGDWSEFVPDLLLSQRSRERGILNPVFLQELVERHRRRPGLGLELWTAISFEMWCRTFLDSQGAHEAPARDASRIGRAMASATLEDRDRRAATG
jgi:asparagine synthase (glutamine-hydrolysing)